jgi:cell division septation protein DedD
MTTVLEFSADQHAETGANCVRRLAVFTSVQTVRSRQPPSPPMRALGARMAHDIPDDGFHEIQLSGKQLVFLFMATTVVSVVIFLCGIIVGRGVQNARGSSVTEAAGPDAAGADAATAAAIDDDSTGAPASGKPTSVSGLTYAENLSAKNPPSARVEPGAGQGLADTPAPSATPAAETPAPTPPPAATPPPPEPKAAPPAVAPPPAASSAPAPAEDGGFTVQVTALKNRPEADEVAKRLQARGYQAYVVGPGAGGQVIYKVRVGMNMQRPEADKVMRRLQSEEKFKPWITR